MPPVSQGSAGSPREILIIKPSSLGDVVHTLPAVARLKQQWPDSRIRWLINAEWAPLLEGNPHVDEALIFPRREFRGMRGALRVVLWARTFRERVRPDLVLDFQGLLRSALIAKLCRGGTTIGLSDAREGARFLYDQTADVRGATHAVDRYLRLIDSLGIDPRAALEWPLPQGATPADFGIPQPFVLLHPFARGEGKSLDDLAVTDFCRAMEEVPVVIAGRRPGWVNGSTGLINGIDLVNQTGLGELIWLIRNAAFVVSVDSGPMHIAAAITSRLVSIHTWTDPQKVGPYRPDAWIWQDGNICRVNELNRPGSKRHVGRIEALAAWVLERLRSGD